MKKNVIVIHIIFIFFWLFHLIWQLIFLSKTRQLVEKRVPKNKMFVNLIRASYMSKLCLNLHIRSFKNWTNGVQLILR